jgi:citrate lyase subunit beta/citryl-CoA lyase
VTHLTPLFVPADRPERFAKAASSGADAMIIDLEDAISPDVKDQARLPLIRQGILPGDIDIFVRVNAQGSLWHKDDIDALTGLRIAGIMLPKSENAGAIERLHRETGWPLVALIETARGLAGCRDIACAAGVMRLAFGSIDYAADLGMAHGRETLLAARAEIVLASRLAGLPPPIDGVTTSIDDEALVADDARYAVSLGLGGKLCIHPKQIAPTLRGFAPSEAEMAWARRVLAAPESGAVSVDGMMVDAPVRIRAGNILTREKSLMQNQREVK